MALRVLWTHGAGLGSEHAPVPHSKQLAIGGTAQGGGARSTGWGTQEEEKKLTEKKTTNF